MPRKSTRAASGSSPEKPTASSRRNTRRGQKVTEEVETEVIDEIPPHLLRASDESSEHSDNDSDYGSPKKGRGRGRGRGRKPKEPVLEEKPVARPRRGRRGAAQSPAVEEQNSQEYQESAHSQTTNDEHDSQASTMESEPAMEKEKSTEPVEGVEKQENEQISDDQNQPTESVEVVQMDEVESLKKHQHESVQEEKLQQSTENTIANNQIESENQPEPLQQESTEQTENENEKVSEVTEIEQDLQSNNDNAPVNEDKDDEVHEEKENNTCILTGKDQKVTGDNEEESEVVSIEINEKEDAESVDDEISKDAPELPMEDQSDSRSNSSERDQPEGKKTIENDKIKTRSRSSSGEIHEDSVEKMEVDTTMEIQNKTIDIPVKIAPKVDRKSPLKVTDEKPHAQRKRKWGARKTDDEPVIAITTDSLKNVIAEEVKPVDVKLPTSPSPEPEEKRQRVKLTSEDREIKKKLLKERLRKQEEEEDRRNEQMAKAVEQNKISPTIIVTNGAGKDRKVSVFNPEEVASPPTPPKNQISKIICITNLVRPLTFMAVKQLVARTGEIEDFWIDQIKSKCFVVYKTEDEAVETRHALHGVKWPEHNLKTLNVEFSTQEEMDKVVEATRGERITTENSSRETKHEKSFGWSKQDATSDDRSRSSRRVREWDVGKKDEKDDEDRENRRRRRSSEQREKKRRVSKSPEHKEVTPVPQQRLLDDLFRKTKAPPFIYWMPLSEERIKELEEQRQKNIAEHNRCMEEMMKLQKERREAREQRMREEEKRREERRERDRRSRSRNSRNRRRSRDRSSRDRDRNRRYDRR